MLKNSNEVAQAARVLRRLGDPDFQHGIDALTAMLDMPGLHTQAVMLASARSLLALATGDFAVGILALAGVLLNQSELVRLPGEALALREAMGQFASVVDAEVYQLAAPRPADPQQVTGDVLLRALAVGTRGAEAIGKATKNGQGRGM